MKTIQIVSAVIRSDNRVLMVQQPDDDQRLYWFIPGGKAEKGEWLLEALHREIKEETGLQVGDAVRLAYITHIKNITDGVLILACVFEVLAFEGQLAPDDPDQLTHDVAFVPFQEALAHLEQMPWAPMRDPLLAYLRQQQDACVVWQYEQHSLTDTVLIARTQ